MEKERETMCLRKKNYASKSIALNKVRDLRRTVGGQYYVYRCPHCSLWHITTHFSSYLRYKRMFRDVW